MSYLFTLLIVSLEVQKFLILLKSDFSIFPLVAQNFGVISKNPLPNPKLWRFTPVRFSKSFMVFSSVQFSRSVMSSSFQPHESQHTRPPCPSPTLGVHSHPCPLSRWCHPAVSSSVVPFSSCPQFLPASGSFLSQLFAWGGQSTGVSASASVLPVNTQDWSPLGWTGFNSYI